MISPRLCINDANKSIAPRVCQHKVSFLTFFDPDMKTSGCGHIHIPKTPPYYIDSKYIWVHGSNSLGSSVFAEIPFLAFLALHKERRCGQVGPSLCYSQSEVVYVY